MARILDSKLKNFEQDFLDLLASKREGAQDVTNSVAEIIDQVRQKGDAALFAYSRQFDHFDVERVGLRVGADEINAALATIQPETMQALELAGERIRFYHQKMRNFERNFTKLQIDILLRMQCQW